MRHEASTNPGMPADAWMRDAVETRDGVSIPVRATARRPRWEDLPVAVRARVQGMVGCAVVGSWSTGTGFTPGFASRLDLADGRRVFVKAASSADDLTHGWQLSAAYREEVRKLTLLPPGLRAPALLWSLDDDVERERWVVLGLQYVEGRPPRRPWRPDELGLVTDMLADIAPLMTRVPLGLELGTFGDDFGDWPQWLAHAKARDGASGWLEKVAALAAESVERCSGTGMAHLDLRDDNLLIDAGRRVWICDWNFPMLAAPWVDLVCVLASAFGDGLEVEPVLASHPLTRDVDSASVDSLLANLWLYFTSSMDAPVPPFSPHLRDHQRWYTDATEGWLRTRLHLSPPPPSDSSAVQTEARA